MRNIGLDFLRGIAVILVLFRHSSLENNLLQHFGWLGVDLFFVLSGFLISNLLFREYKKNRNIRTKRFLIRRAFKIVPPFYIFMFSTLSIYQLTDHLPFNWLKFFSELLYVQNYFPNIWFHTWSLAVEAHFYLIFTLTVLFIIKKQLLENKVLIISFLGVLLIVSFIMRLFVSYPHRNDEVYGFVQTHLRSDGILFGILMSYLLNFTKALSFLQRRRVLLLSIAILLIAPAFYFVGGGFFMNTVGLTIVNLGFCLLVFLSLNMDEYFKKHSMLYFKVLVKPIGFIGVNSYSIYLWHLNSKSIVSQLFSSSTNYTAYFYIVLSIVLGIFMSYLVEKPALILRDFTLKKAAV